MLGGLGLCLSSSKLCEFEQTLDSSSLTLANAIRTNVTSGFLIPFVV